MTLSIPLVDAASDMANDVTIPAPDVTTSSVTCHVHCLNSSENYVPTIRIFSSSLLSFCHTSQLRSSYVFICDFLCACWR